MTKAKTYRVVYEHDGAMWYVHVAELEGCHSQGRTIAQARERIREALGLFDSSAPRAILVDEIKLPRTVLTEIKKVREVREKAEALSRDVGVRNLKLAKVLTAEIGVSLSDAGELLGFSKQHVQQILKGA